MKLLEVIKKREPIAVEFDKDFIVNFKWDERTKRYQSRCGFLTLESLTHNITGMSQDYKVIEYNEKFGGDSYQV